jgi:hypothetical protein
MEINSVCSTSIGITNVKHLTIFQDGTLDFTHIAGGKNFPVDYNRMLFSKTNGFASLEDMISPNGSTKESDSIINLESIPDITDNQVAANVQKQIAAINSADQQVSSNKPGVVTFAGVYDDIFGLTVMLDHGDGTRTIIPNLKSISISVGTVAKAETPVGMREAGLNVSDLVVNCNGTVAKADSPAPVKDQPKTTPPAAVPTRATTSIAPTLLVSPEEAGNMLSDSIKRNQNRLARNPPVPQGVNGK